MRVGDAPDTHAREIRRRYLVVLVPGEVPFDAPGVALTVLGYCHPADNRIVLLEWGPNRTSLVRHEPLASSADHLDMISIVATVPLGAWGEAEHCLIRRRQGLTTAEAQAVVARNSIGCIRYSLSNSASRTIRVRYAGRAGALYIPAWTSLDTWYQTRPPKLECDVSEVEGRSCWRYVWMRGRATPLHPTGVAGERQAWRDAITVLRRVVSNLPPSDELAVANFGVVRLDVESLEGAIVPWE